MADMSSSPKSVKEDGLPIWIGEVTDFRDGP